VIAAGRQLSSGRRPDGCARAVAAGHDDHAPRYKLIDMSGTGDRIFRPVLRYRYTGCGTGDLCEIETATKPSDAWMMVDASTF